MPVTPHVAHLTPAYLPILGGKETHIHNLVSGMGDFTFTVVTSKTWAQPPTDMSDRRVHVQRIGPPDFFQGPRSISVPPSVERLISGLSSAFRLTRQRKIVERTDVDVVHSHWSDIEFVEAFRRFVSRESRERILEKTLRLATFAKPTVFTDHSMFMQVPLWPERMLLRHALANYDAVVCVEREGAARAGMMSEEIGDSAQIEYIPNSVDCDVFRPRDNDEHNRRTVCFIGRANKSHSLVLELCRRLNDARFLLVIAGDRRSLKKWRSLPSARVRLFENAFPWELPAILREADVVLNPILYHGISRVTLEALASGVPVVSAEGQGRYPLVNERTGLIVSPTSHAFEKALISLLADDASRRAFGRAGRAIVEREFSNSVVLPKLAQLYRSLAQG